jgi:PhzF family phenazine biosynthesis protein
MKIPYYHVDAFASARFCGNPAGVCVLQDWLPDEVLQKVAFENNLSETAFVVAHENLFELRWFTPIREVSLCGHATLAAALVIFEYQGYTKPAIHFQSKSGVLTVTRDGAMLMLDFPARSTAPCAAPEALVQGLGKQPLEVRRAKSYMAIFARQEDIASIKPDMQWLSQLDSSGIIVTAPGNTVDFVSRFFAPKLGIPEDPVTGSSHCSLIPYWAERLSKKKLTALQLSARGGELFCEHVGERVKIGGNAVAYLTGEIEI